MIDVAHQINAVRRRVGTFVLEGDACANPEKTRAVENLPTLWGSPARQVGGHGK